MFSTRCSGTKRRKERYENLVCSFLSLSLSLSFLTTRFDILIESRLKVAKKLEPCESIWFDGKASWIYYKMRRADDFRRQMGTFVGTKREGLIGIWSPEPCNALRQFVLNVKMCATSCASARHAKLSFPTCLKGLSHVRRASDCSNGRSMMIHSKITPTMTILRRVSIPVVRWRLLLVELGSQAQILTIRAYTVWYVLLSVVGYRGCSNYYINTDDRI